MTLVFGCFQPNRLHLPAPSHISEQRTSMSHPHTFTRSALVLFCLLVGSCARAPQPSVSQTDSGSTIESPALPPIDVPADPSAGSSAITSSPATTSTDP